MGRDRNWPNSDLNWDIVYSPLAMSSSEQAQFIRARIPSDGLFFGHEWRISPEPFPIGPEVVKEFETLGRVLLQFYRAINLLYRQSVAGKQPEWVAGYLDRGKPPELLARQRSLAFKNEVPRVIRPDVLLTESGLTITELDSVPGGIGLTAWLNQTYSALDQKSTVSPPELLGGAEGMHKGFAGIFGDAPDVHVVVSEEAATYRPEMRWFCHDLDNKRFTVRDAKFDAPAEGDAVYRFFELFD